MLRFPMFGFSRRVDDTVARAMAILNTRPDYTAGPQAPRLFATAWKPTKRGSWRTSLPNRDAGDHVMDTSH